MAIFSDVLEELLILLRGPEAFSQLLLVAAGMSPHLERDASAMPPRPSPQQRVWFWILSNYQLEKMARGYEDWVLISERWCWGCMGKRLRGGWDNQVAIERANWIKRRRRSQRERERERSRSSGCDCLWGFFIFLIYLPSFFLLLLFKVGIWRLII